MVRKLTHDQLVDRYIGSRLAAARTQRNHMIEAVAQHLGVPAQQLLDDEAGNGRIMTAELAIISLMYDLPIAHVFDGLEAELARLRPCAND